MKSATKTHVAWLTTDAAAEYLGFPSSAAFRRWLSRNPGRIRTHLLGERMRFRQTDLDAAVEAMPEQQAAAPVLRMVRGGRR